MRGVRWGVAVSRQVLGDAGGGSVTGQAGDLDSEPPPPRELIFGEQSEKSGNGVEQGKMHRCVVPRRQSAIASQRIVVVI